MRALHLFAAAVLGACITTEAAAADRWTRVATDHFEVVGNITDSDLRRVAQTLEHFHDVVVAAVLHGTGSSGAKAVVLVFKDDISFTPYKPQGSGRSVIGSLFSYNDNSTMLALNAENRSFAYRTALNGYSRAVASRMTGDVPRWLSTGLGQVYETFEERNGGKGALIGRPDGNLMEYLKTATLMPLATLVAFNDNSPGLTLGSPTRTQFDAQSWALVHYLTFGARRDQLGQYLAAIRSGAPQDQAFRAAVGDLAVLERELNEYVRKFAFPAMQIVFDEKVTPSLPPRGEVLSEADAESYLAGLLERTGYPQLARARLEKAITATPTSARATAALGHLEISENQFDKGLALYEKAATLAPGDQRIQADLGHYLAIEVSRKGGVDTADALTRARASLNRAVELDSNDVLATAELGWMLLFQPDDPARAATLLARAGQMAPGRDRYKLWLADALLRQRKFDEGRNLLGPLMARGSTPEVRSEARALLARVSELQRRDAAATMPPAAPTASPARTPQVSSAPAAPAAPGDRFSPNTPPVFIPTLRTQQAGESRVVGLFTAVECSGQSIALVIVAEGRTMKLATASFDAVDFISYRQDAPRTIGCGAILPVQRVLATYRAGTSQVEGTAGGAVAIELLPDGFSPQ